MNRQTQVAAAEWADPVFGGAADSATREAYAVDGVVPQAVLFPRSQDALAETLKAASERGLALIPCRNKTKLATGNIPRRYDAALCLKEMNAVWHYEPDDLTVSAEPGMKLGDFQRLLSRHGLWIPVDPQGGEKASLGGIVAANASGPLRLKFGTPRDFVIGMKIATTAGKIVRAGGQVVKNVAGYDFCRLLTGSFGSLGVIAEITFKLFPLPEGRSSWRATIPNLKAARELRRRILESPLSPMRMVLLDGGAAAIASGQAAGSHDTNGPDARFEMWLEFGGSEMVVSRCGQLLAELANSMEISFQPADAASAEEGWDRISDFAASASDGGVMAIILKVTLPIAYSEEFVGFARSEARGLGARLACFCQNGVGIVQVCLIPEKLSPRHAASIAKLRETAIQQGGALVVEQCPVELKRELDVWGPVGSGFALMKKLKEAWDPSGTLSPGRFVGGL